MLQVFVNVVLPVFGVAFVSYLFGRWRKLDPGPLSQMVLYLFSPALAFSSLIKRPLPSGEAVLILAHVILLIAAMSAITYGVAKFLRFDRVGTRSQLLTVLFANVGNFGLSVSYLAYGDEGLQRAIVFFVSQTLFNGTLGVYISSSGVNSLGQALKTVFTMPLAYTGAAAVLVATFGIPVPGPLLTVVDILGDAAVPGMLAVLGLQMAVSAEIVDWKGVLLSSFMKLAVSTVVALALAAALGMSGMTRNIVVLQASMPTAVFTVILATEYNLRPQFVTSTVIISTLLSLLSLTILLSFLQVPVP